MLAPALLRDGCMNVGIYQGAAAMSGIEQWQNAVARNLASSSVPGYKKTDVAFDGVLRGELETGGTRFSGNSAAMAMPTSAERFNFSQGALRQTGNPHDLALRGEGFFSVEMPGGQVKYTRDGEFHFNAERVLVNKEGLPVLGQGGPIAINPNLGPIAVSEGGLVTQGATRVDELRVTRFENPHNLVAAPGGFLLPGDGSARPEIMDTPHVLQGHVEDSNVSAIQEMIQLITLSNAFEANQKVIRAHDEQLEQSISQLAPR